MWVHKKITRVFFVVDKADKANPTFFYIFFSTMEKAALTTPHSKKV